jgi:hypothetical protein
MVFILVAGSGIYKALHLAEVPGVDTGTRWNDLWSSKDLGSHYRGDQAIAAVQLVRPIVARLLEVEGWRVQAMLRCQKERPKSDFIQRVDERHYGMCRHCLSQIRQHRSSPIRKSKTPARPKGSRANRA